MEYQKASPYFLASQPHTKAANKEIDMIGPHVSYIWVIAEKNPAIRPNVKPQPNLILFSLASGSIVFHPDKRD